MAESLGSSVLDLSTDDSKLESGLDNAKDTVKTAAAAIGAAAAAAFTAASVEAVQREALGDKLAAQIGLSESESQRAGDIAGRLYADAYGSSLEEVNTALDGIHSNIGDLASFSNEEIESMAAKALDLAAAYDLDVNRATRAAGQLMRNELVADADEAFDVITAGMQGLDASMREELIDTLEEYSGDFRQLGLTGPQAVGMLSAAVQAGARNTDIAADAIREFSILAIDGSERTAEGFEALGFNADEMAAKIAAGGPGATQAMSEVIGALSGVGNKVDQEAIGVALFGTKFEEMGIDAISALDPVASEMDNTAGAADRMGDTLNDNAQTKIEAFKRSIQGALVELVETPGVVGDASTAVAGMAQVLEPVGPAILGLGLVFGRQIASMIAALGRFMLAMIRTAATVIAQGARMAATMTVAAARAGASFLIASVQLLAAGARMAAAMALTAARVVAGWALMAVQSLLNAARMAAAWFIALGPIGWITAAVIGLVALIIANWDTVWSTTKSIFSAIWSFLSEWWPYLLAIFTGGLSILVGLIIDNWDSIWSTTKSIFSAIGNFFASIWSWIVEQVRTQVQMFLAIINWFSELPGKIKTWFGQVKDGAIQKLKDLLDWTMGLPGEILSALGNLGSLLLDKGEDVLNGLWQGMKNVAGQINEWILGLLQGMGDAVKDFFGISSPSKLMIGYGEDVGDGLGVGLGRSLRGVSIAANVLARAALPALAPASMALATAGAEAAGPDSFTADAVLDLGEGIQQVVTLTFSRKARDLKRRVGQGTGRSR